jgi:hypothetical protein
VRQAARGRGQARGRGAAAGRASAPAKPRGFEARRLGAPRPARVEAGAGGRPVAVAGMAVDAVLEDWVVEDRWWTAEPLRRRYFELVLADGRNAVVFHELEREGAGHWFAQRG